MMKILIADEAARRMRQPSARMGADYLPFLDGADQDLDRAIE